MDPQQAQADNEALASALSAISHPHSSSHSPSDHHFHHPLTGPDFSHHKSSGEGDDDDEVDVGGLEIPVELDGDEELEFGSLAGGDVMGSDGDGPRSGYGRPPSIRKACDLCHAAKQKCSGDRPACTRCAAGGWPCIYAPRQRRRTVPKDSKHHHHHHHLAQIHHQPQPTQLHTLDTQRNQIVNLAALTPPPVLVPQPVVQTKKRKMTGGHQGRHVRDDGTGYGDQGLDKGFDVADLGMGDMDEGDELLGMSDDQMLENIAIDGYLADLPLATFVHNLPIIPGPPEPVSYTADDFPTAGDAVFPTADMDQHTTSALREAIFSLNESNADRAEGGHQEDEDVSANDPHLALLDLTHAMPADETGVDIDQGDSGLHHLANYTSPPGCSHIPQVPHILALLTQHPLEPKPGSNTPLTLGVFAPLARSLRLFNTLTSCSHCTSSPHQTLPQLALLSRTTTILTFPFPPLGNGNSAQITVHGAKLTGTGLSEAIEQHIVGVVWDSWRAAVREIFASFERRAQEVITQTAMGGGMNRRINDGENGDKGDGNGNGKDGEGGGGGGGVTPTSAETQRAGLMFQAMSRLVTAMDEVEGN